jgi:hypothetical protein
VTPEKMDKITTEIVDLIRNHGWLDYEDTVQAWRLLSVIASLHNELYKEVTGKYYNYMFHWANLGWMGDVNEDLFKEAGQHQESGKNNKLEAWMNRPEEEDKKDDKA